MEYELMFLIAEDKKPDLPRITNEIRTLVENAGGTWVDEPIEFEKKLAFEIKHSWRGFILYSVLRSQKKVMISKTRNPQM